MFRVGTFEVIEAVTVLCYQPNWFKTRFNEGGVTPNTGQIKEELPVLYRRMQAANIIVVANYTGL